MIGLAVSQFFWENHHAMYRFFQNELDRYKSAVKKYLEIGPGHSLFLKKAIEILDSATEFTAVDISPTSISFAESIIQYFFPSSTNIRFINDDMLNLDLNVKYDFVALGEVLEHVAFPGRLLAQLQKLLSSGRYAYVSTCVNAPAIDHVYHYKRVGEIREMINAASLNIIDELVLPAEKLPMAEIVDRRITINYCCIAQKT
jgi:SAM-dependent methyltransferase